MDVDHGTGFTTSAADIESEREKGRKSKADGKNKQDGVEEEDDEGEDESDRENESDEDSSTIPPLSKKNQPRLGKKPTASTERPPNAKKKPSGSSSKRKQLDVQEEPDIEEDTDSEEDPNSDDQSDGKDKPEMVVNTRKRKKKLTDAIRWSKRDKPPVPSYVEQGSGKSGNRKHPKSKKMPLPPPTPKPKLSPRTIFPSTSRALDDHYIVKFNDLSVKQHDDLKVNRMS
jgi:hypothetical protein